MGSNSVNIHEVKTIRVANTLFFGVGAIEKMTDIAAELQRRGIQKVVIVTGRGAYKVSGAWATVEPALQNAGIAYTLYDRVSANPTADQIDEATRQGQSFGARAVIGIGGGSAIDTAKSVAILLEYPEQNARSLYRAEFTPERAVPNIAINLSHGTGTEVNQYAVTTFPENEHKPAIGFDFIYPLFAIDDPALMTTLPADQTRYVSSDALNHVIEAATSQIHNPLSITLAREAIALVAQYLPQALKDPNDLEARYFLLYASMLGGIAIDNSAVHLTHALEHPLSGVKQTLPHALGLSMLLPAMIRQIYPARASLLADLLRPIVPGLQGTPDEASAAAIGVERWLFSVGITQKLEDEGFQASQIDRLVALVYETPGLEPLLGLAPIPVSQETLRTIYQESLRPCSVVTA